MFKDFVNNNMINAINSKTEILSPIKQKQPLVNSAAINICNNNSNINNVNLKTKFSNNSKKETIKSNGFVEKGYSFPYTFSIFIVSINQSVESFYCFCHSAILPSGKAWYRNQRESNSSHSRRL